MEERKKELDQKKKGERTNENGRNCINKVRKINEKKQKTTHQEKYSKRNQ